jgi:hypothetical protein
MTTSPSVYATSHAIAALITKITRRGYEVRVTYENCRYTLVVKHPSLLSSYIANLLLEHGFMHFFCYAKPAVNLDNLPLHQSVFEMDLVPHKSKINSREE